MSRTLSSTSAPSLLPQVVCLPLLAVQSGLKNGSLAYLTQSEETPKLDEAMEVSEANVDRNEDHVFWIAHEVTPKLYRLAEQEGPAGQGNQESYSIVLGPRRRSLVEGEEDHKVIRQSPCRQSCLQDRVRAPGLRPA